MAIKISVINFKGGVGKTTLSFHLAAHLSKIGRTLLIDVDHQSSLSIVGLGNNLWESHVKKGETVNRVFEAFCNRKISTPGKEIIVENALYQSSGKKHDFFPDLDIVPAQFQLDDTEIDLASTNYGNASLSDWEKRTLLASWLDSVGAHDDYKYIIFDCPPATKIVSQNALAASDFYVVPVIPDEMSSRGATHFRNLVNNKIDKKLMWLRENANVSDDAVPINFVPDTKLAAIVPSLARIAHNAASGLINLHTEQIGELRGKWKAEVTKTVIKNLAGVGEAMNHGWPVWVSGANNVNVDVRQMMTEVCSEIKDRIDP